MSTLIKRGYPAKLPHPMPLNSYLLIGVGQDGEDKVSLYLKPGPYWQCVGEYCDFVTSNPNTLVNGLCPGCNHG